MPQSPVLPTISIVTPSFNQATFLEECIDSVLSQNYPNLEYIIMDGGSTDGSVEIIRKYEKYLTYWQSQPDGGQYKAVDDGFRRTTGDVMAWLNSDDKYHRDVLTKVSFVFNQDSSIEWLTGRPTFWGKNGEFMHLESYLPTYSQKDFLAGKYNQPFIQQESTFWKRSLWVKAGYGLKTELSYAGDLELWLRFFRHALLYSVDTFLGGYRSHGNQKAALHMDRYIEEADSLIAQENELVRLFPCKALEAPPPIAFDVVMFKAYLSGIFAEARSPHRLVAAQEDAIQYLLKLAGKAQQGIQNNNSVQELGMVYNSLSWRLTQPIRWLMDKLNR